MHVPSTGFPQRGVPIRPRTPPTSAWPPIWHAFLVALIVSLTSTMSARSGPPGLQTPPQTPPPPLDPAMTIDPGPIFRVFLADGRALASYGECAFVDDRVVFTLAIGDGGLSTEYQLMSLPASAVDVARTTRYRDAVRARRYATTRGEDDYAAMTAEVSRSLDALAKITNPALRLEAAEEAKRRLLAWSEANYHYRAKDIQDLAALFDEAIAELRVAAGGAKLSLDLVAGSAAGPVEPIRASPSLRESIEMALGAAMAADVSTDRVAILRAAQAVSAAAGAEDLSAQVARHLDADQAAHRSYLTMRDDALARANQALSRGDVAAVEAVRAEAIARERALAVRRSDEMQGLLAEIDAVRDRTRVHRLALDRYAVMRPRLLAYERDVRPILSALEGAGAVLRAIHDMKGPSVLALVRAEGRLGRAEPQLASIGSPEDLSDVHATFLSALHLAVEACKRRRLAIATNNTVLAREASASAAGAQMLADSARQNLITRLFPPQAK